MHLGVFEFFWNGKDLDILKKNYNTLLVHYTRRVPCMESTMDIEHPAQARERRPLKGKVSRKQRGGGGPE